MTKKDFIAKIAKKAGFTQKDTEVFFLNMLDVITEGLKDGEDVPLIGFGKFQLRQRKACEKLNPKTKEIVKVEPRNGVRFKPSKALKDYLNT